MLGPLSLHPLGSRGLSSLPCCPCIAPGEDAPYSLLSAGVCSPPQKHFPALSLCSRLFCLSSSCCWCVALVGAGRDQAVLPGMLAAGISSIPARSWQNPREGSMRLPLCSHPNQLPTSILCARDLPDDPGQALPGWWCHVGGTGGPELQQVNGTGQV